MFTLTNTNQRQEFLLMNSSSLIEVKKILLVPKFEWKDPNEWGTRLESQNIGFKLIGTTNTGRTTELPPRFFVGLTSLYHFRPVVTLHQPITLSGESIWERSLKSNDYPIKIVIEIVSEGEITFDVRFVYDAVIE